MSYGNVTDVVITSHNVTMMTLMNSPLKPIADPNMPLIRFICEVTISLPVAIFGIFGNILAFVVLRRQKKYLTTNVLLQALAVIDTLILICSILLRSMRYVNWSSYNDVYHYIFISLYPCVYFFRMADTWITVLMTVDRYIAVCHPLKAQRLCTLRRTYVIISVIFFTTFTFSMPRFFEFELTDELSLTTVGYIHTELVLNRTYTVLYRIILFFVVMYLVPMISLMALNIRLLQTIRRASRNRDSMVSEGNLRNKDGGHNAMTSSRHVTLTVVAVVIVCVICNMIAMTTHVIWAIQICFRNLRYLEMYRRFLANISNIMITFNSAINFVVYCAFSRKFRFEVKRMLSPNKLYNNDGRQRLESVSENECYTSIMSPQTIISSTHL
ncbi:hypothetical protein LSH36_253g01012 [Paralvinella palmiformis]|uniref:G-protein coupled receptors family 1 profile domain-containing protein n=1 Tax=Paralvinella palmiformis TaxID=53620 RepID=A0AAD9N4B3_9ANNE|nr:hypothetical protein LSH36_253g01012 [Paralvinella palmiformis]